MRFGIKRLGAGGRNGRRYHLFDEAGRIKVVADRGSPWLAAESNHHVRFARPSGDMVASMGLASHVSQSGSGHRYASYAIIVNHAVYAIINEYYDSTKTEGTFATHFTVEVEGMQWLVLEQAEGDLYFRLYDQAPTDLTIYNEPIEARLPEPVGQIYWSNGEYDFTAEIAAGRLAQASLVLLALIFLIDRPVEAGIRN